MRISAPINSRLGVVAALLAPLLLLGCGQADPSAPVVSVAAPAASSASSALVHVEPVSKVAKAPGIDPMKASTLPPMPESARFVLAPAPAAATTEVAQAGR